MWIPIRSIARAGSLICLASTVASSAADSVREIQELLDRPVLATEQTWQEAGRFCDLRVPPMPEVKTAAEWKSLADGLRRDVLDNVVFRGTQAKRWREAKTQVVWHETLPGGPGYVIRKVRYEALPGLWIPAVLYAPEKVAVNTPVHLAVNGHEPEGKAAAYNQLRCINLAKRGIISLNIEWFAFGQLRTDQTTPASVRGQTEGFKHAAMNQLDLCGVSGLAPFYLSMSRGLDLLLSLPNADAARVAVSGLSGGGWQTIVISSLDPRVTLSNPVAGYSSFHTWVSVPGMLGDSEQAPNDLATVADYTHLTAMMAGRSALLTYNAKDACCFVAEHTLAPLMRSAAPVFELHGQGSRLRSHVNHDPGTHNYLRDNREAFYRFVGDIFFPDDTAWDAKEIESEAEVKTKGALDVELPSNNLDFNLLARAAMQGLPRDPEFAQRNPAAARAKLRDIVHSREHSVEAKRVGSASVADRQTNFWQLHVGPEWTVPVTEFTRAASKGTTIVLGDAGRRSLAKEVNRLIDAGQRVLAVDVYGFGESRIVEGPNRKDYAVLIAAVGERPLGVQSDQLAAVARWAAKEFRSAPASLVAIGPRTSVIALVTAALQRETIGGLETQQAMDSLKELIEKNVSLNERPEQFCFGLLETFDIPQLRTLGQQP